MALFGGLQFFYLFDQNQGYAPNNGRIGDVECIPMISIEVKVKEIRNRAKPKTVRQVANSPPPRMKPKATVVTLVSAFKIHNIKMAEKPKATVARIQTL